MRKFLSWATLPALLGTIVGLGLATAGSASATTDSTGSWRPYGNTNPITSSSSSWGCSPTHDLPNAIKWQVCAVVSASRTGEQGAVIVRNNGNVVTKVHAEVVLTDEVLGYRGDWTCGSSGVAANSWSVCFGPTVSYGGASVTAAGGAALG